MRTPASMYERGRLPYKPTVQLALLAKIELTALEKFILLYCPDDEAEQIVFLDYLSETYAWTQPHQRTQGLLEDVIEAEARLAQEGKEFQTVYHSPDGWEPNLSFTVRDGDVDEVKLDGQDYIEYS